MDPFSKAGSVSPQSAAGDEMKQVFPSEKNPSKGSVFSNFFKPISRTTTPRPTTESPSGSRWRIPSVPSFTSLFRSSSVKEFEEMKSVTPTSQKEDLETTKIYSSPETVIVSSPVSMGFASFSAASSHPATKESTLSKQGSVEAGEKDREKFVGFLKGKWEAAKKSQDPESQTKKDIDRAFYFINGERVTDVEKLKNFLGEAAEALLPLLNQTIPNVANDVIFEKILQEAPLGTVHPELAISQSEEGKISIRITKKEGSSTFLIEVESRGPAKTFFKKIEEEGEPDFEHITLDSEDSSPDTTLSAEGRQLINLELTQDDAGSYSLSSLSCSKLIREYQITA